VNIHKNAKLTPKGREEMVKRMQTQPASLALWINWYNSIRSHSDLGKISPAKWLTENGNNVSELNT